MELSNLRGCSKGSLQKGSMRTVFGAIGFASFGLYWLKDPLRVP